MIRPRESRYIFPFEIAGLCNNRPLSTSVGSGRKAKPDGRLIGLLQQDHLTHLRGIADLHTEKVDAAGN